MDTNLAKKMIERADKDNLPNDHPLRKTAIQFEEGAKGFYAEPQVFSVKQFMGRYARAKLTWSEYSGEDLI